MGYDGNTANKFKMSKRLRTTLFIFFVTAFVIGAPALALYAQGYRINWPLEAGKKLIVKTGGLFVKVSPKQIAIYVDGQMEKQTDFFFDSALVTNLLPRLHQVQIKKNGYQTWEKNLEVKEKEVVEAKNVFLFPEPANIDFPIAEKNIDDFLLSPDKKKIALRYQDEAGLVIKSYDIAGGITIKLIDQSNFAIKDPKFGGWKWLDEKTLEIWAAGGEIVEAYSVIIDKTPPQIIKKSGTPNIAATTENATITQELAAAQAGDARYYLANDGSVYKAGNSELAAQAIAAKMNIQPQTEYDLWIFGNYYFVKADTELFVAQKNSANFEKILKGASANPKISPNGQKIAYWSDSEIWILYLENKNDQPTAKAGDKIFIARLSEKITDCDWFNSDYLIFTAGDKIKTAEIDNRDKINFADLAQISKITKQEQNVVARMFMNQNQKTVYLFANNTLYKSEPIE